MKSMKYIRWMMVAAGATMIYVAGAIAVVEASVNGALEAEKKEEK